MSAKKKQRLGQWTDVGALQRGGGRCACGEELQSKRIRRNEVRAALELWMFLNLSMFQYVTCNP